MPSVRLTVVDDDDPGSLAADDPTAMWDESSLRELGIGSDDGPSAPATSASSQGGPSVQVSLSNRPQKAQARLSWMVTIGIALVLGVGVFFVVRMLR